MSTATPFIRITKRWSRNSSYAQMSYQYYLDIALPDGRSASEVGISCHAGEMSDYGMSEARAKRKAAEMASFFGWPVRAFEVTVTSESTLTEIPSAGEPSA